jgi:hypothetical protein
MNSMKHRRRIGWGWWTAGAFVVILIAARLSLPYFVTRYVNKVLAEIPGYYGTIYDVDINLYRGAYVIDSLKLFKVDGNKRIPFVNIPVSDLSVDWGALFDGEVVGEAVFRGPVINFIGGNKSNKTQNQTGEDVDWTEPIKKLVPFRVNRLEVRDGTMTFHDFTTKPKVDISLKQLEMVATNLTNASDQPERLPSTITLSGTSIGGGNMKLDMQINVLKEIPDLDMDMRFENVDMKALNDFFRAYAGVDVSSGNFNLYAEMAVNEGIVTGYVKPIAQNVKLIDFKEDNNPVNLLWETIVATVKNVFKNQKENQLATRVPLVGDLNKPDIAVWPTVWNVFRNGFVKAFEHNTDNTVKFAQADTELSKESKKETRKRERRERREAKRKARKSKS